MAMKKCKECGTDVSSKADSCPKCGARLKAKPMGCGSLLGVIILGIIILTAFGSIFDGNGQSSSTSPSSVTSAAASSSATSNQSADAESVSPSQTASTVSNWSYTNSKDSMSGKGKKTAAVVSQNSLHLSFPYNGSNHGYLRVRQHPQYGLDVIVSVDKGQILCDVYTCKLKIRFDRGAVKSFTMLPAADHSSTVVFAKYPEWAIKRLTRADEVSIQVPMYQEGNQVLKFKVEKPLVWPPK